MMPLLRLQERSCSKMFALLQRNIKIYFSNISGVIMSCLGALILFFIYIGFLQKNLASSWSHISNANEMLDLWMIAGIVAIAGITTSFQALGQWVKDQETRTIDDMRLTDVSASQQLLAYVLSGAIIGLIMQIIVFIVMSSYFTATDHVSIPTSAYLPALSYILITSIAAASLNAIIVFFIHSSTTFSRLSAVISAASGFAIATYIPYGTLPSHAQTLVKLIPSSYETSALRSLLLNPIIKNDVSPNMRKYLVAYLGIHFKINGYQLNQIDNALIMLGMTIVLITLIIGLTFWADRKRNN